MVDNYYKTKIMGNSKKDINEELKRFRAINKYAKDLIYEQAAPANKPEDEDPTAPPPPGGVPPELTGTPPEGGAPEDAGVSPDMGADSMPDMGGGGGMGDMGAGAPPDMGAEPPSDTEDSTEVDTNPSADDTTEELDVTDLVDMTKSIKKQLEDKESANLDATQKMDSIFAKLSDLESKLGEMDSVLAKIDQLGGEIEEIRPKTPIEKLEMRSLDSYPFNQKPDDFFTQKQQEMRASGKNEYILTKDDVENYGKDQIMKSFKPNEDEEDGNEEQQFKY